MNFGELVVWLYKKLVISIILILIATSVIRSATKPIEVGNSEFPLQQKWSAKMKDRVVAVSASENGTIFARSPYSLNALDASTGKLLWKFLLEGQADSRPALSLNEIVYVSDSKYIYALDENNGKPIWQHEQIRSCKGSAIDLSDSLILFHNGGGLLSGCSTETGVLLWQTGAPKGNGNDAYINDNNKIVYNLHHGIKAIDAITGNAIWQADEDGSGFYENEIIYRTNEFGVNAFNTQSQSYVWLKLMNISSPYMTNFVSGKDLFAVSDKNHIYVFQKSNGAIKWKMNFGETVSRLTTIEDNLFALDRFKQIVHAFDINTGKDLGELRVSIPVFAAIDYPNFTSTTDALIFSSGKIVYLYGK